MSEDPGHFGFGFYRSPTTNRLYLLSNGYVVGEVPPEAEDQLPQIPVRTDLHAAAELDYTRRKYENLKHYLTDLDMVATTEAGRSLPLRSAADFRISELARLDFQRVLPPFLPRLSQLGNTGTYAYAQSAWRHLLRPDAHEMEILRRVPNPQLIGDAGLQSFVLREWQVVDRELDAARRLLEALHGHPDNNDVNRSYG